MSATGLARAQQRLHERASLVTWLEADITTAQLPAASVDVWHDRAAFHFLNDIESKTNYLNNLLAALTPSGYFILATFAEDGPLQCSGLPVTRYSTEDLTAFFGTSLATSLGQSPRFNDDENLIVPPWRKH